MSRGGIHTLLLSSGIWLVATASASTPIQVSQVAPSDSVAGPFVIHVKINETHWKGNTIAECVIEARSDSVTISRVWARLEAGDRRLPNALWLRVAPERAAAEVVRYAFGLRSDLARLGRFILTVPAPSGDAIWAWEIPLASHMGR